LLNGKTAVITGASRGIGRAIALKFASLGANIAIIYAGNTEMAEKVKAECEALGVKAETFKCDVSDFSQAKTVVSEIKAAFGGFDILVNNAGITKDKLTVMMKESDFDDVINVNLKGCFNMIRQSLPVLMKAGSGKIINISSVVGLGGNPGQSNYAASKAGIIGMTKSVAKEFAVKSITCNAIAPGLIETDMTAELNESNPLIAAVPMGRAGKPEDVAETAAFLASSAADYITGEVIRVDGGLAM